MQKIEKWDEVDGTGTLSEKMEAFLDHAGNGYAILQLKETPETRDEWFLSTRALGHLGIRPDISHYEVVYTAPLPPFSDRDAMLEGIYTKFNIDRPEDFKGHSLSVSDIVALKVDGAVSSHYVDSIGFTEMPGFIRPENYLKHADDASACRQAPEDDYNSIDGIIGNNDKSPAAKENDSRPSVLEQLKGCKEAEAAAPEGCRCKKPNHREERGLE